MRACVLSAPPLVIGSALPGADYNTVLNAIKKALRAGPRMIQNKHERCQNRGPALAGGEDHQNIDSTGSLTSASA